MNTKLLILLIAFLGIGFITANYFSVFGNKQKDSQTVPTVSNEAGQNDGWKEQTVSQIGLRMRLPADMTYREELADDYGKMRTMAFYIENRDQSKPEYQLYGLFIADKESSDQDLERAQAEMDKTTIREASIDGYKGIEGLIIGPKTRYIIIIQKDGRLFSVSTIPPTTENKDLTDKIVQTFDFQ